MLTKIESLLNERQFDFERIDEETIATGFSTQLVDETEQSFPLYIQWIEDRYGDYYIRFTIVPFVDQPYDGYPQNLYLLVGQMNHDLPWLKLAFDGDGDLELLGDLPSNNLNDVIFAQILQLLADYAGDYYLVLANEVKSIG
jgi:hypothetical protein